MNIIIIIIIIKINKYLAGVSPQLIYNNKSSFLFYYYSVS